MLTWLKNWLGWDDPLPWIPYGAKRHPQWPSIRKAHLINEPVCQACGSKKNLEVHHKLPVRVCPKRELDDTNLITLCEGSYNCHYVFGHSLNWWGWNPNVDEDVERYRARRKVSIELSKTPSAPT